MKRLTFICAILCATFAVPGQEYTVERKAHTVLSEQSTLLNGGIRSQMGGVSRTYFPIDLPANTVEWYYAFTTAVPDGANEKINLAIQLAAKLDPTGISSIAAQFISVPDGVAKADVFLFDYQNAELFRQKADQAGSSFSYKVNSSRFNLMQGVVPVTSPRGGMWYLGIRNPSSTNAVIVKLEVVAIVEERTPVKESEPQTKAKLYTNMGWSAFGKGDYLRCIELSKKALKYDPGMAIPKYNIALCHLVLNDGEHVDAYVDAIACTKKIGNQRRIYQAALDDIMNAQKLIQNQANAEEIESMIRSELANTR